jgi:predicted small secreted protein
MSRLIPLMLAITGFVLAGCASYEGGARDDYNAGYGSSASPGPMGSPTFRPGMNPRDPRDPNALIQTLPPPASTP